MILSMFFIVVFLSLVAEIIDSSLGMGYGTLLSPILIAMGFPPILVVSSILLSQAGGGVIASIFHHKLKNSNFSLKSNDLKFVFMISIMGIFAVVFAMLVSISIPVLYVKLYISVLVIVMGVIILLKFHFKFSFKKIFFISIISAFNKGLSGGGFGPVVTGGQIITGKEVKSAIGVTTFSEVPICLAAFITYLIAGGVIGWYLIIPLLVGVIIASTIGPYITKKMDVKKTKIVLGILLILLGTWSIIKLVT